MAVTQDRVGILVFSGKTGANAEWVELDWNGNVLERSRIDDVLRAVSLALTADDHVYLQGSKWGQVYTLDHASHAWKSFPQQGIGMLMGADGTNLVYRGENNTGPILLQWLSACGPDPVNVSFRQKAYARMAISVCRSIAADIPYYRTRGR